MKAVRTLDPAPALTEDPVLAAFLNAPAPAEPEADEERAAFELGMADIRAGRTRALGPDEMRATIAQMRQARGE